jgi:hypothetical protein
MEPESKAPDGDTVALIFSVTPGSATEICAQITGTHHVFDDLDVLDTS